MIDLTKHHLFDGGMGTMLQSSLLRPGQPPEELNLMDPEMVARVHMAYMEAGADILTANTFGANRRKLGRNPYHCIEAGIRLARRAADTKGALVALDMGPLGSLLEPYGDMAVQTAYDLFAEAARAGEQAGADLILIETMGDLLEAKTALLAAKENTKLPVFVTMTFGTDGRTFLGVDATAAAVTLTGLGADCVGLNCSLGPREMKEPLEAILAATHLPVMIQPNAGLPRVVEGETVYDVGPEDFACWGKVFLDAGAAILGGCCGTTPEHIRALAPLLRGRRPAPRPKDDVARFCGWQSGPALKLDSVATVGELINPTGRKKLTAALREGDWDYAAELAIRQQEAGADFLVVNAGLPDIDEAEALPALVLAIQEVSPLPLVLDSANPAALERALRVCRGRPILNSVNGRGESLEAVLPLAAKYGTGLVVLSLDENGVPDRAEDRHRIAMSIVRAALEAGVDGRDIFIDSLALTASVNQNTVNAAPAAIRLARQAGYRTILGVSNVSYGLPRRDAVNCAFLSLCLDAGLNVPIVNVTSPSVRATLDAMAVLSGADPGCARYIAGGQAAGSGGKVSSQAPGAAVRPLRECILSGSKEEAPKAAQDLLRCSSPVQIIRQHIIPALDTVGARYETGELFLPQLMAAAAAVKAALAVLHKELPPGAGDKGVILLATVKGDVHDIGKNITGMLLENYGYRVIDLGRDVPPEAVVEAALSTGAGLVGLSALMTTTAQNLAVTIQALRAAGAACKVMVGGAVITQDYADRIGADYFAKDAAQSARIASEVFEGRHAEQ